MAYNVLALHPALHRLPTPQRVRMVVPMLRRFFLLVWTSIVLLLATGTHFLAFRIRTAPGVLESPYGGWIGAKLVLVAVMLGIFLYIYFRLFGRLRRWVPEGDPQAPVPEEAVALLPRIAVWVRVNLVLGVIVIFLVERAVYG